MNGGKAFRLAVAQYDIGFLKDWPEYEAKANRWIDEAAGQGAKLLLFPEYFSMELASLFPEEVYKSLSRQLEALQTIYPGFLALYSEQAKRYGVTILAGSFPVRQEDGNYRNRSWLFRSDGSSDYQDKLQMTRFENEQWLITAGSEIKLLDTEFGKIGVNICYDSEFPMIARKQVEAGPASSSCPVAPIPWPAIIGCASVARRGLWKTNAMWRSRPPLGLRLGRRRWMSTSARRRFTRRWIMAIPTMACLPSAR